MVGFYYSCRLSAGGTGTLPAIPGQLPRPLATQAAGPQSAQLSVNYLKNIKRSHMRLLNTLLMLPQRHK